MCERATAGAPRRVVCAAASDGMTLIEVLVAITIFCMCIGGLCRVALLSHEISDRARSHYVAANMARNRIEAARVVDFRTLPTFVETQLRVNSDGEPDTEGHFRRTTAVSFPEAAKAELEVTIEIIDRKKMQFTGEQERVRGRISEVPLLP